jgi:hypothetical protein
MKKMVLSLILIGLSTLFAACTPSVGFSGPSLSVPINLDLTPEEKAQQEAAKSAPAPTTEASSAAPTTPPVNASQAQVASGSAGNIATSIKVLPGNSFPFEDGFENFSVGQVLAIAAPQNYGILRLDGKDDPNFAKIEQTFDASNQPSKALQINSTGNYNWDPTMGFVTLGSAEVQNYRASFDFKTDKGGVNDVIVLKINIGNGGQSHYEVQIKAGQGSVTMDKILGDQKVQVLNRDGLGFAYSDNIYHQAEVVSQAGTVRVTVDGNLLVEYNDGDANYQKGGLGFGYAGDAVDGSRLFIDNLRIANL